MGRNPALKLDFGDWLKDGAAVRSLAAQGLWLRMLFVAQASERPGFLTYKGKPISDSHLARLCGVTSNAELHELLTELETASVFAREADGTIYSPSLVALNRVRELTRTRVARHRRKQRE